MKDKKTKVEEIEVSHRIGVWWGKTVCRGSRGERIVVYYNG